MAEFNDAKRPQDVDGSAGLLIPGSFGHPTATRARVKREGKYTRDNVILINDLIRGVSSDIEG
ncbi:MAG: hypothetical protein ACOX4B_05020 [Bacillota bacterium]